MKTTLVSPFAERHSAWTFYAGFNEIHNTGRGGMESAEEVTPLVLDWLERNAEQDDWLLYVNYWDPHTPYRAPEDFGNPFENEPLPDWINETLLDKHISKVGPHSPKEINMYNSDTNPQYPRYPGEIANMKDMHRMIDGYDCGIKYMDEHVGMILSKMKQKGIMDDVVIIITADHGENMGELGIYGEHGTADQGTCRIPMIIRWPGHTSGTVNEGLHYHLDLPPTMADMLGLAPAENWDGTSYANAIRGGTESGRDYLVVSQCAHVCQRSVRFDDWLYIRTYHDGYHLFDKEMLFNVKEDPYEQHNIAAQHRELCMQAVYYLNEWHDEMMSSMKHDADPLWTVMSEGGPFHAKGFLKEYAARLEATGRAAGAEELRRRHPQEI